MDGIQLSAAQWGTLLTALWNYRCLIAEHAETTTAILGDGVVITPAFIDDLAMILGGDPSEMGYRSGGPSA